MKTAERIKQGAFVIKRLSLKMQIELLESVQKDKKFSESLLAALGEIEQGRDFIAGNGGKLLFPDLLYILNFDTPLERWLMDNLLIKNPELFDHIARNLFIFEDIVLLDREAVKKVFKQIPLETAIQASLICPVEVKEYVFKIIEELGKDKIVLLELVPKMDTEIGRIYQAQFEIIQVIRELESRGEIIVQRVEQA